MNKLEIEEKLKDHDEHIDSHEVRIKALEESKHESEKRFISIENRLETISNSTTDVKNTVLEEGRDRRRENDVLLKHILENDVQGRKHKRSLETRNNISLWQLIINGFAVGGFLYIVIEFLITKWRN